jgi:hypothetical protein
MGTWNATFFRLAPLATLGMMLSVALLVAPQARASGDAYVNPYMFSINSYNLGVDFNLNDQWSAGPYAALGFDSDSISESHYWGVGGRADFCFTSVNEHSWYVSPFASRYEFTSEFDDADADTEGEEFVDSEIEFGATNLGMTAGFRFVSDEEQPWRFMVRVGLGAMYSSFDGKFEAERKDGTKEKTGFSGLRGWLPTGDIHVGLLF